MKRHPLTTNLAAALLLSAGVAQADVRCAVPMTDWQPRDAVAQLAADKGWIVRRIKIDDGCYEVSGTDAEGHKFKVKLHPATLTELKQGLEDDELHKNGHDDDKDNH